MAVTAQYGIEETNLLATVTDAGSDVFRCGMELLSSNWEWCIPHMLNTVLKFAFAASTDRSVATRHNSQVRTLMEDVKRVITHIHGSDRASTLFDEISLEFFEGKAANLSNGVCQRWVSNKQMLERFLERWEILDETFYGTEPEIRAKLWTPISDQGKALRELYSLMKPIAELIVNAQSKGEAITPYVIFQLQAIRLQLQSDADLEVFDPLAIAKYQVARRKAAAGAVDSRLDDDLPRTLVRNYALTPLAETTKRLLREALDKRWFRPRYWPMPRRVPRKDRWRYERVFIFDVACCFFPPLKGLEHLRTLVALDPDLPPMEDKDSDPPVEGEARRAKIDTQVAYLRNKIHTFIMNEMCKVIEADRIRKAEAAASAADPRSTPTSSSTARDDGSGGEPPAKRAKTGTLFSGVSALRRASKGLALRGDDTAASSPRVAIIEPASDVAKKEFQAYERYVLPEDVEAELEVKPSKLLDFWRGSDAASFFPNLATVATAVLSVPPSSAVLERDFSIASIILNRRRGSLDGCNVEMMMTCHAMRDGLHCASVPLIDKSKVEDHLPSRFKPEVESQFQDLFDGEVCDALLEMFDRDTPEQTIEDGLSISSDE
jgi:hypothetical protein